MTNRTGVTVPPGTDAEDADARAVNELLRDVSGFRLGWDTDLTLAAAAAEVGSRAIAVALLTGRQQQLAEFEEHILRRLADLTRAQVAAGAVPVPVPVPVPVLVPVPVQWQPPDGRRLSMPVTPGVSAPRGRRRMSSSAAAIAAVVVALVVVGGASAALLADDRGRATVGATGPTAVTGTAGASSAFAELQRVVGNDLSPEHVRVAAEGLNRSLADLVARADTDKAAGNLAMELLLREHALLQDQDASRLGKVLVEWQRLVSALAAALPARSA